MTASRTNGDNMEEKVKEEAEERAEWRRAKSSEKGTYCDGGLFCGKKERENEK